jgi:hypothetical protein
MPEGAPLKKYLLGTKDVSAASLSAFVAKYLAGELKPHLKVRPGRVFMAVRPPPSPTCFLPRMRCERP